MHSNSHNTDQMQTKSVWQAATSLSELSMLLNRDVRLTSRDL